MIVVSDWTMCCMNCGGFHFLAKEENGRRVVTHDDTDMYMVFDPATRNHHPCPNRGKRFAFPDTPPTKAIELE